MSAVLCGVRADESLVREVETPCRTKSYMPVPYGRIIDSLKDRVELHTPWEVESSEYSLGRAGEQLFGVLHLADKRASQLVQPEHEMRDRLRPSIGFRSSHDKSISIGIACGASVFVCDNMMFDTSGFTAIRKHTTNVFDDLDNLVVKALQGSIVNYSNMNNDRLAMKQILIEPDQGYEILGKAYGHKVITAQQFTKAVREWNEPSFDTFDDGDAWSLYNAVTFAMKNGATGRVVDRYIHAHSWFRKELVS